MGKVRIELTAAHYCYHDGTGYGDGSHALRGKAHEAALKEAETDATKRALVPFGDPFGLALYDKEQRHVEGDQAQPTNQQMAQQFPDQPQAMKTCVTCGTQFKPKFDWAKDCFDCYKKKNPR